MKLATRPSAEAGCIRALQNAFSTHASAVSVKEFGVDCYTVRFIIEDQVFACIATSAMPGFSRPEDTMFLAESFALARESEWVMIDGFSPARRPNSESGDRRACHKSCRGILGGALTEGSTRGLSARPTAGAHADR
jgi:hypothetical protein